MEYTVRECRIYPRRCSDAIDRFHVIEPGDILVREGDNSPTFTKVTIISINGKVGKVKVRGIVIPPEDLVPL